MKPGRELDALVAEKVMGWHRMRWIDYHAPSRGFRGEDQRVYLTYSWHDASGEMTENAEEMDDYYCPSPAWSPSTDIANSWKVVEKMQKEGWDFQLDNYGFDNEMERKWRVCVAKEIDEDKVDNIFTDADTAPHAICLAALKAVE